MGNVRQALRDLRRDHGYAAVTILTLALAIGANTLIFSLVNTVLLRPLGYREPGRLMVLNELIPAVSDRYPVLPVNGRHYLEWKQRASSFEEMAALLPVQLTLTHAGEPRRVSGARISPSLCRLFDMRPALGRLFTDEDDRAGHQHVALITESLWERSFGRDRGVLGKTIGLDGESYAVVGVIPSWFRFPEAADPGLVAFPDNPEVFKPIAFHGGDLEWFGQFNFLVLGRLKPGVTERQALAQLNVIQAETAKHMPEKFELRAALFPLEKEVIGSSRRALILLLAAVGAVLLIGCANLANLSLARTVGRSRDLAIRAAMGASRSALLAQVLTERHTCGSRSAAGIAVAWAGLRAVIASAPAGIPRLNEATIDARVLLFSMALSVGTGLAFGIFPGWRAASADPQEALRGASRNVTDSRSGLRLREVLVAFEVGISAMLLIQAELANKRTDRESGRNGQQYEDCAEDERSCRKAVHCASCLKLPDPSIYWDRQGKQAAMF